MTAKPADRAASFTDEGDGLWIPDEQIRESIEVLGLIEGPARFFAEEANPLDVLSAQPSGPDQKRGTDVGRVGIAAGERGAQAAGEHSASEPRCGRQMASGHPQPASPSSFWR